MALSFREQMAAKQVQQPPAAAAATQPRPASSGYIPGAVSFAGVRMSTGGWNEVQKGEYDLEIERTYTHAVPGKSYTWVLQAKVLASTNDRQPPGTTVHVLRSRSNPMAEKITLEELKAVVVAAAGTVDEAEFEAMIPDWTDLCNAVLLEQQVGVHGANPLAGAHVHCLVTESGKLNKRGQDFGRTRWSPAE